MGEKKVSGFVILYVSMGVVNTCLYCDFSVSHGFLLIILPFCKNGPILDRDF